MSKPGLSACRLAICMACAFVATAPAEERADPAPNRPFIEASYIVAPLRIGDFTLEDSEYDENNKASGAGFRYALGGHRESRIDVFVYPAGAEDRAQAMEQGMAEFKAGIHDAEKAGYYSDVRTVDDADFPLHASTSPVDKGGSATGDAEGERALRGLVESTKPVGRRLRMQLDMQPLGIPMHSYGYLFYKQLYFFKVRVSAARERIDEASFMALADDAVRTLVPAIEVANVGGCMDNTIEVPTEADPDAIARILILRTAEIQDRNCFDSAGSAGIEKMKSKGARVVTINFDRGDWGAK